MVVGVGKTGRRRKGYTVSCEMAGAGPGRRVASALMNRRDFLLKSGAAVSLGLLARSSLSAQVTPPSPVPAPATPMPVQPPTLVTEFRPLRGDVGYFTGRGGSIGWLSSAAALVAVDTQFPDTAAIFLRDLPGHNGRTLDAVINTHHHGDHTGGNGVFKPATKTIVAQANVPDLMLAAAKRNPTPMLPRRPCPTPRSRRSGATNSATRRSARVTSARRTPAATSSCISNRPMSSTLATSYSTAFIPSSTGRPARVSRVGSLASRKS